MDLSLLHQLFYISFKSLRGKSNTPRLASKALKTKTAPRILREVPMAHFLRTGCPHAILPVGKADTTLTESSPRL